MKVKTSSMFAATALLSLALVGCGEQQGGSTGNSQGGAPSASPSPTPDRASASASGISPFGSPVACADLLDEDWIAPETDPSINFDPESGVAEVSFTDPDDTIVVDVLHDPDCVKLSGIGQILARTQSNFEQSMRETCEDLVTTLNSGKLPEREGMTADPEGGRKYVLEECPEKFADELKSSAS